VTLEAFQLKQVQPISIVHQNRLTDLVTPHSREGMGIALENLPWPR
jgi:hypothetical protein